MAKGGGTFHPQRDTIYSWATRVEDDIPQVHHTLWADMPGSIKHSRLMSLVKLNRYSTRCAITGVQCFCVLPELYHRSNLNMAWAVSNEHLLSVRYHRPFYEAQGVQIPATSMVLTGSMINLKLGHTPASLKLLLRRHLKNLPYDRDAPDWDTFLTLKRYWIDLEDSFKLHGKYPWQPQAYTVPAHKAASKDFLERINKQDREFFESLTLRNRWEAFDSSVLPIELNHAW